MKKYEKIIFIVYSIIFVLVIMFKFDGTFFNIIQIHNSILQSKEYGIMNINIIPFKTISTYIKHLPDNFATINLLGNIVPFIPLGYFISNIFNRNKFIKIVMLFLVTLSIESIQFIFSIGFFDIDDIILNFIGLMIGYLFLIFYNKYKRVKYERSINK